jgi:SAM-dependent MidA family methyltransferase
MTPERAASLPTPLAAALADRIRREGPIGVDEYVAACLTHPEHGYYTQRRAIGRDGDFITAPEISQMFGELVGLWCAVVWQQMGAPPSLRLIELGPGRGTLMRDVLRAARALKGFREALRVELVEVGDALAAEQRANLADETLLTWHGSLQAIPREGPAIVIANEFLDALPLSQWVRRGGAWHRRCVGLDGAERLAFVERETAADPDFGGAAAIKDGDIFETRAPAFRSLIEGLSGAGMSAGLFIDYGHEEPAPGDTLQAVRAHRYEHPFTAPGECDLTAQVDFASFCAQAAGLGLLRDGPVTQAEFLGRLGITERASRLMAANPDKAGSIEAGAGRLMAPGGMGTRFKAVGLRVPSLPPLPGLEPVDRNSRPA